MVLGIESRGFIIGAALAYALGVGIAIVRKPGKLPSQTYSRRVRARVRHRHRSRSTATPSATATRVLIVDDLLATGGTASAADRAGRALQGEIVECALRHRARLPERPRAPGAAPGLLDAALRSTDGAAVRRAMPRSGAVARTPCTSARTTAARCAGRWRSRAVVLRRRARRRLADQQPGAAVRRGAHAHRRRRARRSACSRSGSPSRPPSANKTFGYYRAEILAALANGVALCVAVRLHRPRGARAAAAPRSRSTPTGMLVIAGGRPGRQPASAPGCWRRARAAASICAPRFCTCSPTCSARSARVAAALIIIATGWYGADAVAACVDRRADPVQRLGPGARVARRADGGGAAAHRPRPPARARWSACPARAASTTCTSGRSPPAATRSPRTR